MTISIHALRVEGDRVLDDRLSAGSLISIHALRVEGDRRAFAFRRSRRISIHALRVEGDLGAFAMQEAPMDFYPRPPGGGRPPQRWHT